MSTHKQSQSLLKPAIIMAASTSLSIFVSGVLLMSAMIVIDRFLDGNWRSDYQVSFIVILLLSFGWFLLELVSMMADQLTNARLKNSVLHIFPSKMFAKILFGGSTVFASVLAWGLIHQKNSLWYLLIPLSMGLLAWSMCPRTIHLTDNCIWQRKLLAGVASIGYGDIQAIAYNPRESADVVYGKDGTQIAHSAYHLNRDLFEAEIERITGKRVSH